MCDQNQQTVEHIFCFSLKKRQFDFSSSFWWTIEKFNEISFSKHQILTNNKHKWE